MNHLQPIEYLQSLFQDNRFDDLIDSAGSLLAEEPQNVRGLYWRACALMRLERHDEALEDLNLAIEIYDEYADAFTQRGVLYFHRDELQLAMIDMDRAVELEPENPYRYSSRAYIKSALDQVASAIRDYEWAIHLDPEDAVAHNNLGLLQEKLGYKSQAQRNFEKADRLMVNEDGELVERSKAIAGKLPENELKGRASFLSVLRSVFTTRKGFLGYWKYLKSLFSSENK